MILGKLKESPEKMIPAAMAFVAVGMAMLTIGITWPRLLPTLPHNGTDWNDFLRGATYGIAIVFEITGLVIATSAAAKKRKAP